MHQAAWDFVDGVKAKFPDSFKDKRVLEVGSRYINGTVRTLFEGCDYTGLDLSPGPCVDLTLHVTEYPEPTWDLYETIISCEALEHDKRWRESLIVMYELLIPKGFLILTAGGTGRPEHGTTATCPTDSPATTDYYGNITEELFWSVLRREMFDEYTIQDVDGDFRFVGVKA